MKITWSASSDGTVAAPYASFLGMSERELPSSTCSSGILVIPIQGLSVGGVDPRCKSVGYIILVRNGKDNEKHNFKHYRDKVFREFVKCKRSKQEGLSLDEDDRAVGFLDGGGAQLVAVTNEKSLAEDENIKLTLCKHSASRSGSEQYLDLSRIFKTMHRTSKMITAVNRPVVGFKKVVHDKLNEYREFEPRDCLQNYLWLHRNRVGWVV